MANLNLGTNITATLDGNKLTLIIDISEDQGRSKSGKSTIIATTNGNQALPGGAKIGLNLYK